MAQLDILQPQLTGAIFRAWEPFGIRSAMRVLRRLPRPVRRAARLLVRLCYTPWTPKTRFLLISLSSSMALLGLADAGGVLVSPTADGARPALSYLFSVNAEPSAVSLSLLQDPAGLIILAVVFVTPMFYCQQVRAISDFVPMNERNGGASQLSGRRIRQLNRLTARTNRAFAKLGRRDVSAAIMASVAVGTALLYMFVNDHGLLEGWNSTTLPDAVWRSEVYDGWWANRYTHPELAMALCVAGAYAFYFLAKQLAMGVVFTMYLKRSSELGFGVTPNMAYDSDGFQGLRTLRQFMLWSYGSALAHLAGLLVLFVIWLSAAPWTLFAVVVVMMVDALVIIYPSSIGYHSALDVKKEYVASLSTTDMPANDRDAAIAQVWSVSVLPIGTRKAITAITGYLLVPAVIALLPQVVQRR